MVDSHVMCPSPVHRHAGSFAALILVGALGCSSTSNTAHQPDAARSATGGAGPLSGAGGAPGSGGTTAATTTSTATGGVRGTGGGNTGGSATGGARSADAGGQGGTSSDAGTVRDARTTIPDVPLEAVPADARALDTRSGEAGAAIAGPQAFHCVNWADPRDNYVNGLLALSGLSSSDSYATVQSKADAILSEFQSKLKANAIRIPINEPTVASAWWKAYQAVVDTAASRGLKVIIAYWAYQNGKPDDAAAFTKMWQSVVAAYQDNDLVYFDIHNEPYGYDTSWNDVAAQWLSNFPSLPRGRVIVAGTGYDENVVPVGGDTRFAGCILQLHIYGFWHDTWTTQKQWSDSMTKALGSYAARTLVGEWGAPMTTGTDYSVDTDGDAFRSYVRAVSKIMHDDGMGSCYWPGLRNGDSYSMTTLGTGSPLTLTVTNASGLDRLQWTWQL